MASFKLRHAKKLVSLFILVSILIFVATLVFTGDITEIFSSKYYFESIFKDASGLSEGVPVKLMDLDIEIGKVESVESNNVRGEVRVRYSVIKNKADTYLKRDTIAFLVAAVPIIGQANLLLTIGEDEQPLVPIDEETNTALTTNMYIPSNQTQEGLALLMKDFYKEEGEDSITSIINNLDILSQDLSSPTGPLFQTLANIETITNPSNSEILQSTNKLLSNVASLTGKLEEGDIGDLLGEPVYEELMVILEEVEMTVKKVRNETLEIINDETLVSLNNMIDEQNKNVSVLLNDSIKTLIDDDIKTLVNAQISPAVANITNSIDTVSTQLDSLLSTLNSFVSNSTDSIDELINRTTERVNLITEEVSDGILTTLQSVTTTITELEEELLTQVTDLLDELTTTVNENVNPAISEITEDVVVSVDTITKGITETIYELQLVIGEEARYLIRDLSLKIQNILTTVDELSATAEEILDETAPEIAEAIKSLSKALKDLPELIDNLNIVLDTADLTLRRVDIVLERLDSILSGLSGGDSLPLPGRTGQDSQRGDSE